MSWSGLFLSMLLMACAASTMEYTVIDKQVSAGKRIPSLHFEVITEEAPFKKLFTELHSHQLPSPLPPEIDFDSSFVILISMGEKPSTGYRVEIDQMKRVHSILKVKLRLLEPSPEAMNAMVITQPFVMAKVKKAKNLQKIEFLDQTGQSLYLMSIPQ
jgi:hypothetical protein